MRKKAELDWIDFSHRITCYEGDGYDENITSFSGKLLGSFEEDEENIIFAGELSGFCLRFDFPGCDVWEFLDQDADLAAFICLFTPSGMCSPELKQILPKISDKQKSLLVLDHIYIETKFRGNNFTEKAIAAAVASYAHDAELAVMNASPLQFSRGKSSTKMDFSEFAELNEKAALNRLTSYYNRLHFLNLPGSDSIMVHKLT